MPCYTCVNIEPLILTVTLGSGYSILQTLQGSKWLIERGHRTHKVEIKEFKPVSEWTLKLRLFSDYRIICPTSYLHLLVSFTLFCSPFMKDLPLESVVPLNLAWTLWFRFTQLPPVLPSACPQLFYEGLSVSSSGALVIDLHYSSRLHLGIIVGSALLNTS